MKASRRVPTSVLVLLAVAVLAAGTTWWVESAPKPSARAGPTGEVTLVQLEDGTILTQPATAGQVVDMNQFRDLEKIITTDWPCRPDQSDSRPLNMMDNQGPGYVPQNGVQVIQLPRCSAQSRPGR